MPATAAEPRLPQPPADPAPAPAVLVDVVVLSDDLELFQVTRDAVGERNPVWRARTASESVDLLMTGRCGVLLLDLAIVSTQPASLIRQVVDQFPDVVVVVAGSREDEPRLGRLLSDGLVYRFMHKPLSPKRAGMFLGAAIRCHAERRDNRAHLRLLPQVGRLRPRLRPRSWALLGGGLLLLLALLGGLFTASRNVTREDPPGAAAAQSRSTPRPAAPDDDPVSRREPRDRPRAEPGTVPARQADRAPAVGARPRASASPPVVANAPRAAAPEIEQPRASVAVVNEPASAPRAATAIVRPDPLAPRVIGRATPARPAASRGGTRSYGAPIASGHAIAGFAAPVDAAALAGADDPAADPPPAVAGVESRDLVALATPAPGYPPQALRSGLEGWVEVEFTVDERGATADILVASSEPAGVFDAAATAAVAGWRYLPRVVNGHAVPQRTSVTLRFSVER